MLPAIADRLSELPPEAFQKQDSGDDAELCAPARLVKHIDHAATLALTDFYRATLPAGSVVLELISSWISHLPQQMTFAEVVSQGLNAKELSANSRLIRRFVQDLMCFI